ncbi:MAG: glycosyl transferase family 2 [Roseateles depolymerans]|uniref:Glycosyl transferase family 2 n=1 Tax=Roseateles depolymerans TaxID=76731 RepID=A0A2W5DUJ6_9BURK|nr:MAG: glycosyl transferase family 2 [Roseateles depolymerans]
MNRISVLIFTKNEQQDLPGCLASVAWSDDIHVLDSMSTDATARIAQDFGAHVTLRDYGPNAAPFGGDESAHRNSALRELRFKHPWVFLLDADERATPMLAEEMQRVVGQANCGAFRIQRRDFFMGSWLKHVQASPYYIRLFRPEKLHYERLINPVTVVDGEVLNLRGYLDHFPFSKGIGHWFDRHNAYSRFEAQQIVENRDKRARFSLRKAFFCRDFNERRFHQKELFYRLPFRPLAMFLVLYVGKRGFLDGRAGFTYACMRAIYEYMIVLKVREHEQSVREQGRAK